MEIRDRGRELPRIRSARLCLPFGSYQIGSGSRFLRNLSASVNRATVVAAVGEHSRNLTGVDERIRELLHGAQILYVDETGMRVVGTRHWLHIASTDRLTCYGHHRKRGTQATDAMGILPGFQGTMIHEFWAPDFGYSSDHAICNAHLLRELQGISENAGHRRSEALRALLIEMKTAVDTARQNLPALLPAIRAAFEERYRSILEAGGKETETTGVPGEQGKRGRKRQSKAKNLLDRCHKYQREILAFLRDFTIPFTNNQAERDLRMMKLQQKISGTFQREEGARNFCRVRGFIATVKKHDRPVLSELGEGIRGDALRPDDGSSDTLNCYEIIAYSLFFIGGFSRQSLKYSCIVDLRSSRDRLNSLYARKMRAASPSARCGLIFDAYVFWIE